MSSKESICNHCSKKGHYAKVCHSKSTVGLHNTNHPDSTSSATVATISAASPSCLEEAVIKIEINKKSAEALIDTGNSESFLSKSFVQRHNLAVTPGNGLVSMASTSLCSNITEYCLVNMKLKEHGYIKVKFTVLSDLDVVIGHDVLRQHSHIQLDFGGKKTPLTICSLAQAQIDPLPLFANPTPDVRPMATKSRRYTFSDKQIIENEIQRLLSEGIIEEGRSRWRAQALVTTNQNHKKRMVIDNSQTVNRFTLLDVYPLPSIEGIFYKVSQHSIFSTIDLSNMYYQIRFSKKRNSIQHLKQQTGCTNSAGSRLA